MSDSWLELLKVGDPVIVERGYDVGECVRKVERTTTTRVIVDGSSFLKRTGRVIGADPWSRTYLKQPTPERLEAATESEKRRRLIKRIKSAEPATLPTEVLERIVAAMNTDDQRQEA